MEGLNERADAFKIHKSTGTQRWIRNGATEKPKHHLREPPKTQGSNFTPESQSSNENSSFLGPTKP